MKLIALIIIVIFFSGCISQQEPENDKIKIVSTFYPLYEFSKRIGGDKVEVSILVPSGVEPHDWEPGPKDIIKISSSKIFVYNGGGFEPWVEKMLKGTSSEKLIIIDSSKGIELIKTEGEGYDPHIWLDPILAKHQVTLIEEAIIKTDKENEEYYKKNANELREELSLLDNEIKTELNSTTKKVFISSHTAFSYFAKRYGLKQISISGLSPNIEPSPSKIVEIIEIAKENNVKYIFFETLTSPKLSQVIAEETGAKTLVLNPIEGLSKDEINNGKTYFSVMRENLRNLKTALGE